MVEVVAALIWEHNENGADQFMIAQRPQNKARGLCWEFVGGKVDPGETKEEALMRECREELAITVAVGDVFTDVVYVYPDITIHLTLFHCTITQGPPKLLEHIALRWITPDQIPQFEFCPADKEILEKLIQGSAKAPVHEKAGHRL